MNDNKKGLSALLFERQEADRGACMQEVCLNMPKKHIANKSSDSISLRTGRSLYEEIIKKEGIEEETFSDQMLTLGKRILSNNGVANSEIECSYGTEHSDQVYCAKDFEKKGKIHKVPKAVCRQCWERQQRSKLEVNERKVQAMKVQIHRSQEEINERVREEREDVILCLETGHAISKTQCNACSPDKQRRCLRVMQDPEYQREVAKIRNLLK